MAKLEKLTDDSKNVALTLVSVILNLKSGDFPKAWECLLSHKKRAIEYNVTRLVKDFSMEEAKHLDKLLGDNPHYWSTLFDRIIQENVARKMDWYHAILKEAASCDNPNFSDFKEIAIALNRIVASEIDDLVWLLKHRDRYDPNKWGQFKREQIHQYVEIECRLFQANILSSTSPGRTASSFGSSGFSTAYKITPIGKKILDSADHFLPVDVTN